MEQFKSDRDDLDLKINLDRCKTSLNRKQERMAIDWYILAARAEQAKQSQTGYKRWALKLEHQMVKLMQEAIEEARDHFLRNNVDNERAIANNGYTKLIKQNDVYMKKDEEKMDSALAQLKEQFDALAKEHSILKSLVESSIL